MVFEVGSRGLVALPHGEVVLDDAGRLTSTHLFGAHQDLPSLVQVAETFEFGTRSEDAPTVDTTLVLEPSPAPVLLDVITGPITLPVMTVAEPILEILPVDSRVELPTVTITIPVVVSLPETEPLPVVEIPRAATLWGRFFLGLLLALGALTAVPAGVLGVLTPTMFVLAVLAGLVGLSMLTRAIAANDARALQVRAWREGIVLVG